MSRRSRRGRTSGATVTPFQQVLAAFAGGSVFTADRYTVDGGSGKVAAFVDWLDGTHTLAQAGANQCVVPAASAIFAGRKCAVFGASEYYDSSRASSTWKYLHDGTGCSVVHVYAPSTNVVTTRCSLATRSLAGGAGDIGFSLSRIAGPDWAVTVRNAGAVIVNIAAGTPAVDTAVYLDFFYKESEAPDEYVLREKGTSVANGNSGGVPSSANPAGTLRLGGTTAASVLDLSRWAATLIAPRVLTANQRATVQRWILQTYGVAA